MIYPTTTREAAAQRSRALLGSTVVEPVSVIFGGPSPEHDVSVLTGLQAERALRESEAQFRCLANSLPQLC